MVSPSGLVSGLDGDALIAAAVAVLEAHDVVFAQVFAALHFDQLHGDAPGVGQAVFAAQRDVGALVFTHELLFTIPFHQGRALHHHPVLSPVMVHLQ